MFAGIYVDKYEVMLLENRFWVYVTDNQVKQIFLENSATRNAVETNANVCRWFSCRPLTNEMQNNRRKNSISRNHLANKYMTKIILVQSDQFVSQNTAPTFCFTTISF